MTHARARIILIVAALVGLSGDVLLRGGSWRLGFALWVLLIVAGTVVAIVLEADGDRMRVGRDRLLVLGGAVLAALGLVLRESGMLYAIDFGALLVCAALVAWSAGERRLARFRTRDVAQALAMTAAEALTGAPGVVRLSTESSSPGHGRAARARALGAGLLLAVAPLALVGALLSSADPMFGDLLRGGLDFISDDAIGHVLVVAALAWIAAGWLRRVVSPVSAGWISFDDPSPGVAFTTVSVALYGLVFLLTIFLGLQARVLFGGAAYLASTSGLSVAEYARSGFFQLVAVGAVVLATLLATDWLLDQRRAEAVRHFRTAGFALVILVAVMIGSAVVRMALYVRYFGLSEERFYSFAGMVWIAVALGWFARTVLQGRPESYASGMLVASALWVVALNVANPQGVVARINIARAAAGLEFDVAYHGTLSADALPTLLSRASSLPPEACARLRTALEETWSYRESRQRDWREWRLVPATLRDFRRLGLAAAMPCADAEVAPASR